MADSHDAPRHRLHNPGELVELPDGQVLHLQVAGAEIDGFDTLAAASPYGLGDLPVMVISAEREVLDGPKMREVMDDLHRELVSRAPQATHHVVEDADHLTLVTADTYAREVGGPLATRSVLEAVRRSLLRGGFESAARVFAAVVAATWVVVVALEDVWSPIGGRELYRNLVLFALVLLPIMLIASRWERHRASARGPTPD